MKILMIFVSLLIYTQATTLSQAIEDALSNNSIIKKKLHDYEKKKKRYLLEKTNYYPVTSFDVEHSDENSRNTLALDNIRNYKMQTFIAASLYLQSADELIAKVKKVYIDLLEQKEILALCKENQDESQKIYNRTKKEYKNKCTSISILREAKKSLLISKNNSNIQKNILKTNLKKYKLLTKKSVDINRLRSINFNYHLPFKYEEIYRFMIMNKNILVNKNIHINPVKDSSKKQREENGHSDMINTINEKELYQIVEEDSNQSKEKALVQGENKKQNFLISSGIVFIFIFLITLSIKYHQEIMKIFQNFVKKRKFFLLHNKNIGDELLYEKELQVALVNDNKNHLLYDISHELSTPIEEISKLVESLKKSTTASEDKKLISNIEHTSFNLLSSIEDIVNRTELYSEDSELEYSNFDLFEKIEFIVETYASKADNKKIEFGIQAEPTIPQVILGDGTKLTKVLGHLISNAINFTSHNGTVNLNIKKLYEEEDSISIKFIVSDSGIGMSKQKQSEIVKIFEQIDNNSYTDFSKNRWGLIISYMTIKLMGGKLTFVSEEEKGTQFSFEILFQKDTTLTNNRREYPQYENLIVGIFLPHLAVKREVDRILAFYIQYLGADCKFIYYDELFNSKKVELPDILFVDQKYTKKLNEMKKIINLDTSIVLRVTKTAKRSLDIENYTHVHTIIKPVLLKKIIHIFENPDINKKLTLSDKNRNNRYKKRILIRNKVQVQSSIYASIFKKLGYEVTIANDNETFISKFEKFDYAIFDGKCFEELSCSIVSIIRKTKTIPLLLGSQVENGPDCAIMINNGMDIESIKSLIESAK